MLTYNVINDAQSVHLPTASNLNDSENQIREALRQWINRGALDDGGGQPAFFCHQLSHQYTEASLKLSRLVGDDYKIVCRAFSAAESVNCMLYLATFERMISGGYDEEDFNREIIDETDEYWRLQTIVDLCGKLIAEDVDIDASFLVDPKGLIDRGPDEEDDEGYTGNEGSMMTLWYRRTVSLYQLSIPSVSLTTDKDDAISAKGE